MGKYSKKSKFSYKKILVIGLLALLVAVIIVLCIWGAQLAKLADIPDLPTVPETSSQPEETGDEPEMKFGLIIAYSTVKSLRKNKLSATKKTVTLFLSKMVIYI